MEASLSFLNYIFRAVYARTAALQLNHDIDNHRQKQSYKPVSRHYYYLQSLLLTNRDCNSTNYRVSNNSMTIDTLIHQLINLISVERQKVLEDKKRETKAWFETYFRELLKTPVGKEEDLEITKKDFLKLLHNKDVSCICVIFIYLILLINVL